MGTPTLLFFETIVPKSSLSERKRKEFPCYTFVCDKCSSFIYILQLISIFIHDSMMNPIQVCVLEHKYPLIFSLIMSSPTQVLPTQELMFELAYNTTLLPNNLTFI